MGSEQTTQRRERISAQRELFLSALAEGLTVSGAARRASVPRGTLYHWRDDDPDFAQAWRDAEEAGADALEDEALRRAVSGLVEPVFYGGKEVGEVRKYSDSLLVFLLKARRPDKYRDRVSTEVSGPHGGPIELTDTEREARIQSLLALAAERAETEKKC